MMINLLPFFMRSLTSGYLKKLLSGVRKIRVKYFASSVHKNMDIKISIKALKVALWMYMIDFLYILLSY